MNRKIGVLVAVLLVVLVAVPALAAQPLAVHIESLTTIGIGNVDQFAATGPAVTAGLICPVGQVVTTSVAQIANPTGPLVILIAEKEFSCSATDRFVLRMVIKLDTVTGYTTARWRILGGIGSFAGLRGRGTLHGVPDTLGVTIWDCYDGKLQL
ncbi:hypothetical protein JW848_03750 [Candidatus Bipolaricaulota bacterium]|nr:hypothetical protein [Candidatus Bipolaricaulota bacterium]